MTEPHFEADVIATTSILSHKKDYFKRNICFRFGLLLSLIGIEFFVVKQDVFHFRETSKQETSQSQQLKNLKNSIKQKNNKQIVDTILTSKGTANPKFILAFDRFSKLDNTTQKQFIPNFLAGLESETELQRVRSALALLRIGPKKEKHLPQLIQAMDDSNARVRSYIIKVLGNMGPKAKEATPFLYNSLNDLNPNIRENAAEALKQIYPKKL